MQVKKWLYQMALALSHMHGHGVAHCDLKFNNILIDIRGEVKVCDLGLARRVGPADDVFSSVRVGCPVYRLSVKLDWLGLSYD